MDPFEIMDPFDSRARMDPSIHPSLTRALVEDSVHIPDTQQNWNETDEEYVFTATLPACDKGIDDEFCDATSNPDDRTLRVNGKQTIEEVKDQEAWRLVQGYTISFNYIVKLPGDVDPDDVTATIVQSKLTVTLPKSRTSPGTSPAHTPNGSDSAERLGYDRESYDAALILQKMSSDPRI